MVITNRMSAGKDIAKVVNDCFRYGVKAVQLREKDLQGGKLLDLAKNIKVPRGRYLLINDRLDITLLSNAQGIHLPEYSIPINYLKKYNLLLGKSVHSLKQAKLAEKEGFNYILFGPVFRTPAKIKYGAPQGLEKLRKVCSSVKIPVYAVGGITPMRVKKCLDAGAYGVAVIREIMQSKNLKTTIMEFETELGSL